MYVWDTELTVRRKADIGRVHTKTRRAWRTSDGVRHPVKVIKLCTK